MNDILDLFWLSYRNVVSHNSFNIFMIIAKSIASLLLVIQFFRLYFSSQNTDSKTEPLSYYKLFRPFFLIVLLGSYTYVIDEFDNIAVQAEKIVYSNLQVETDVRALVNESLPEDPSDNVTPSSLDESMALDLSTISLYIRHPSLLIVKGMDALSSVMDDSIYNIILMIRFASLFLLRFLGPIAIALSIYHRFESFWVNWLKAYGILYLWILVIFMINFFTAGIAHLIYRFSTITSDSQAIASYSYITTVFSLVIFKIYFYFKSKKVLMKIFN